MTRPKTAAYILYIDYPTFEREVEIVKSHVPEASPELVKVVVKKMQRIRQLNLVKVPSIRATVDWIKSLMTFGKEELDDKTFRRTINVIIKNEDDKDKVFETFKLD